MEHLDVRLFGRLEIRRSNILLPSFATRKSERVFAFLVLNRNRLISREILCGIFWGDQSETEARKALRTELWRIRAVLEPSEAERGSLLRVEGHLVGLVDPCDMWVDTGEFEAGMRMQAPNGDATLDERNAARLETAASLYRGDFLEGHYDEWSLLQRERLRMEHLGALERLVAHYRAAGRWLEAIQRGRQLLAEDPVREHIHRAVMVSCLSMGDRPSAVRQYQRCVRSLREELDIEPMGETRRLYEMMCHQEAQPFVGGSPDGKPDGNGVHGPIAADLVDGGRSQGRTDRVAGLVAEVESVLSELYALTERLERTRATFLSEREVP